MLFTKITLENFGVYGGINEFDFTCTPEKPIILIGGTNGAGKTTLFESILLCLYGKSNFDKRITKKLYEKFLENKMHRDLKTESITQKTSIQIDFKFHHNGKVSDYSVNRKWSEEDGKIFEELTIKKDNAILESVDETQWQSFIEELIPQGISKLFFFDGEKIVKIAENENTEVELKSSFDSLLGIDLVEQLQSDLKIYVLRKQGSDYSRIEEQIKDLKERRNDLKEKQDDLQDELDNKNEELIATVQEIAEIENNLSKLGGGYASKRIEFKQQKFKLEEQFKELKSKISKELPKAYSFTLIPNILDEIQAQIIFEQKNLRQEILNDVLEEKKSQIESMLNDPEFLEKSKLDHKFSQILNQKIAKILESNYSSNNEKIFNLSLKDSSELLSEINQIKKMSTFEEEFKNFEKLEDDLQKIDLALVNVPQGDETSTFIKKLADFSKKQGELETEIKHLDDEIAMVSAKLRIESTSIRDFLDQQFKDQDKTVAVELAEKLDIVLKSYIQKLRVKKIEEFERLLREFIGSLMHKENFIDKVSINPQTFEITLYKKNGEELLKSDLSKGEQQMLATAILWSLAKTSEKPLPFMVDTPLARLDVEHRDNLIENFYPYSSHQVVLFSTNSEIDANYYSKLSEYISKSYTLTFVPEEGKSKINSGYFWNEKGEPLIVVQ